MGSSKGKKMNNKLTVERRFAASLFLLSFFYLGHLLFSSRLLAETAKENQTVCDAARDACTEECEPVYDFGDDVGAQCEVACSQGAHVCSDHSLDCGRFQEECEAGCPTSDGSGNDEGYWCQHACEGGARACQGQ